MGQRSYYGNYGKLVRKVGNTVTFPIYIMPKNQSLSFDQEFTTEAGGCPVTKQRTRVVGQRSCYGNYGKLVRKVGNTVTFPIYIMPKNQSLSFD